MIEGLTEKLHPLIEWYIQKETWLDLERYKWEAFRMFNECFYTDDTIDNRIRNSFSRVANLLISKQYYPLLMFKQVIPQKPELLDILFDENIEITSRITNYVDGFKETIENMKRAGIYGWNTKAKISDYQDPRAISVYLSLRFPNKYYIYKYDIYKGFANLIGYDIIHTNKIDRMLEFFKLCDEVKKVLLTKEDFINDYKDWLQNNGYSDPTLNLLTQDFIYSVVRHREQYSGSQTNEVVEIEAKDLLSAIAKRTIQKAGKKIDFVKRDERNRGLGKEGELWALNYEKERTKGKDVVHISEEQGDGVGYDILSVEEDGVTPRYIEVKTTTGGIDTPFFFSDNELQFSKEHKENYYIYRIYDFGKENNLAIIHGGLDEVDAQPVSYRCVMKKESIT